MAVGKRRFLSSKERTRRESAKKLIENINGNRNEIFKVDQQIADKPVINIDQDDTDITWKDGRRLVELSLLAEALKACVGCGSNLKLHNTINEQRFGFASILNISCEKCGYVTAIPTSKRHFTGQRGPGAFDINTKMALGMTDCGSGHRQLNQLFATIGVPGISANALKTREREVNKPLVETAKKSCLEAIEEETALTLDDTPHKGLAIKYDMCWQKRGSGRSYDSPSGVGTAIGSMTGKILDYGICGKNCRICLYAEKINIEARPHNCTKNWNQSSKAMEAFTGAKLMQNIEELSHKPVTILIMDDDAATMSKAREVLGHELEKWSDIGHSKKSVGKALYNLQNKHKILSTRVIQYFQKCFSYAVIQNKDNASGLKDALQAIVEHAFGNHVKCGNWCKAGNVDYTYKSLPHGKPFENESLYVDLSVIFKSVANHSEKLAPGGSTRDVESTNNIYASKAHKRTCYSTSESLENRIAAAAAQKNLGYNYMEDVFVKAHLSPSKILEVNCQKLSKERKRQLKFEGDPEIKKRKLLVKKEKRSNTESLEKKEGVTYSSNMSFASVTCDASIPVIKYRPDLSEVASCENIVVFDLETSSLGLDCDILQIEASHLHKTSEYSTYIQPSKSISTQASAVTGLTSKGGVLFYKGDPVQVLSQEAAFQNFTSWLEQHKPCVLAAHNCKTFDARRLLYSLSKFTCFGEFRQNVSGFVDTLPLFKTFYPDLPNHKQNTIFKEVCKSDYIAHNAIEDVEALRVLLGNISNNYKKFSFTIESMNSQMKFDNVSKVDQETFTTLITQKIISQRTADVMAKSGLKLNHLYYAFEKEGEDGIRELLLEKRRDGSPRVTKNKSIITKLIDYFKRQ
ncbi:uncharacterized protein LOC134718035 [Mytilus trossulus]|uniref:uncharacterized protein LOC134718035 n=1 Tax=Mytilus trossulus TaxID=6551 RepID=UPI003007A4AD